MMESCDIHNVDLIKESLQRCENSELNSADLLFPEYQYEQNMSAIKLKSIFADVLKMSQMTAVYELPFDLILLDENCVIIAHTDGNKEAPGLLYPGASLLEADAGSSGFSMAAYYHRPFLLNGDEHYLKIFKNCVSYALPIVIADDRIGFIGFLARSDVFHPIIDKLLISFTGLVGAMIAKCYETQQFSCKLEIIQEYLAHEHLENGVIALNEDYQVLYANRKVLETLGLTQEAVCERKIDALLGMGFQSNLEAGHNRINNLKVKTPGGEKNCKLTAEKVIVSDSRYAGWIIEIVLLHARDLAVNRAPRYDFSYIVGDDTDLLRCVNLARVVANGNSNVLITGESGTGKEVFAQAIHYASPVQDGPFVAINTSAIPSELIESELFGYTDGAFTGAKRSGMEGKFLQANNGTLFLDEIGDMPVEVQPKLLRVLQDRKITPLGGYESIDLNIRIISATNQDLHKLIKDGNFRSDLYYRLNVVEINIPPLRERANDIPALAEYFLEKFRTRLNKRVLSISPNALDLLKAYQWPGNVRELENVIESSVNLTPGDVLEVKHLPVQIIKEGNVRLSHQDKPKRNVPSLMEIEKMEIINALEIYEGNIKRAAQALQIGRTTLYRRIKEFDLIDYIQETRKNQA